jgi:hypothetical protein
MSSSERLVVLGGIGLGAASVVPWYKPGEFAFNGARTNGWEDPDAVLSQAATLLGVVLAVVVLAVSRQSDRPTAGNLHWGALITIWAAIVFGLVALKYGLNTDDTTVGIYLALTAAVVQLYGAYVTHVEESEATTGSPIGPFPDTRPPPPATQPTPTPTPQPLPQPGWPETTYFVSAWLPTGTTVPGVVAAYRQAFAAEPARAGRLLAEVHALLDPARAGERAALLATHAPQWAPVGADVVFPQLAQALGTA